MKYKKSMYNNFICHRDNGDGLFYNSSTGAIAWLKKDVIQALDNNKIEQVDFTLIENLEKNGFITKNTIDEYARYVYKSNEFKMECNSDSVAYIISLTEFCNLKCIYCFEKDTTKTMVDSKTLDAIYDFIVSQIELNNKKKLRITWFGGEPMLAYEKLIQLSKRIILYCKEKGIEYIASMITNGTLLDTEVINNLVLNHYLKNVQITLDGEDETYCYYKKATIDEYEKVIENIFLLSEIEDVNLTIRLNTCAENCESLMKVVELLTSDSRFKGYIYAGRMMNYDNDCFEEISESSFQCFEKELEKFSLNYEETKRIIKQRLKPKGANCGSLACNRCLIDSHGNLYRCEHHIGDINYVIGDVINGFYRNKVDNLFLFAEYPEECSKCSLFPVCLGGCTSDRIIYNKRIDCKVFRTNIHRYVKYCVGIQDLE